MKYSKKMLRKLCSDALHNGADLNTESAMYTDVECRIKGGDKHENW